MPQQLVFLAHWLGYRPVLCKFKLIAVLSEADW